MKKEKQIFICGGHIVELDENGVATNFIRSRGSNFNETGLFFETMRSQQSKTPFDKNFFKRTFTTININDKDEVENG